VKNRACRLSKANLCKELIRKGGHLFEIAPLLISQNFFIEQCSYFVAVIYATDSVNRSMAYPRLWTP
jgi:hypothetical protein